MNPPFPKGKMNYRDWPVLPVVTAKTTMRAGEFEVRWRNQLHRDA